jgi:signal peptidase II
VAVKGLRWLWISAVVLVLDQLTKVWAVDALTGQAPIVVIPGFFDFSLVHNTGAAFGILADAPGWQNAFFIVVAGLVSVFIVWSLVRVKDDEIQTAIAFALIFGGAVGNVIDRVRQGYVVDFIHWFYDGWHWPTFNIADSAISVGAVLLVMDLLGLRLFGRRAGD